MELFRRSFSLNLYVPAFTMWNLRGRACNCHFAEVILEFGRLPGACAAKSLLLRARSDVAFFIDYFRYV